MKVRQIPLAETGMFSQLVMDYLAGKVDHLAHYPPGLKQFREIIAQREDCDAGRALLTSALRRQYSGFTLQKPVEANIDALLKENTFTVTTAHQPLLFGGPLYFISKALSTIKLARQIAEENPGYSIVPVFWLGGEDHDFEEISQTWLFGKEVKWENEPQGPVGHMRTRSIKSAMDDYESIMGQSPHAQQLVEMFKQAYCEHKYYGEATRYWLNELFGEYGLVILSGDDVELKRAFSPVMCREILERPTHNNVRAADEWLADHYHVQAEPREINLFYMQDGFRERIIYSEEDEAYEVLNTHLYFTEGALKEEMDNYPERFSPNVMLRPIYQEFTLPNLAYVGGAGELAYWLQLKSAFAHWKVPFPMLVLRDSFLWLDEATQKRLDKLEINVEDLFEPTEQLINAFVAGNSEGPVNFNQEKTQMRYLFESMAEKAVSVDPSLKKSILADGQATENTIQKMESRLLKAEKQRQETAVGQIRSIKEKLFPAGKLHERHDNFSMFYQKHGKAFLDMLLEAADPLDNQLKIIYP